MAQIYRNPLVLWGPRGRLYVRTQHGGHIFNVHNARRATGEEAIAIDFRGLYDQSNPNRYHNFEFGPEGVEGYPVEGPGMAALPPNLPLKSRVRRERVVSWGNEQPDPVSVGALIPRPNHNPVRELELKELELRYPIETNGAQGEMMVAYLGCVESWAYGDAWLCLYFVLSDLSYYQPLISSVCFAAQSCLQIALDVLAPVDPNSRVMLHFEGATSVGSVGEREFLQCIKRSYKIGELSNNIAELFEQISNLFQSEGDGGEGGDWSQFLFHRLYIHVLVGNRGADLDNMSEELKKIRADKWHAGQKGYRLIEEDEKNDLSCGLLALLWGLTHILYRLNKKGDAFRKALPNPELYTRYYNYTVLRKESKTKTALHFKLKFLDYLRNADLKNLTHSNLIYAMQCFSKELGLDIGLAIFDAVHSLREPFVSWDCEAELLPLDIVCLAYWKYPCGGGHYDVLASSYITRWVLRSDKCVSRQAYSFRSLGIVTKKKYQHDCELVCEFCRFVYDREDRDEFQAVHQGETIFECDICGVSFPSKQCYDNHSKTQKDSKKAKSACVLQILCDKCDKVHLKSHDCSLFYCPMCTDRFPRGGEHACYIGYLSRKKKKAVDKVIYFDFESDRTEHGIQRGILIWAMYNDRCSEHQNSWDGCLPACNDCKRKEFHWLGEDCILKFLNWIEEYHLGATLVAHNGGKYDFQLVLKEVAKGDSPFIIHKEIPRGSQIIYMELKLRGIETGRSKKRVRFIDSLSFITFSISKFGEAFELKQHKGFFPYDLLMDSKWKDVKVIPPLSAFCINSIEIKNIELLKLTNPTRYNFIKEIEKYREEWEGKEWNAVEKLKEYCQNDVQVLMQGCTQFRKNFYKLVGIDPFMFPTLPSAVAGSFRQEHFMSPQSLQLYHPKSREWQGQCIFGGRTECFVVYWRATSSTEEIKLVDVRSEYPYVMAAKNYPVGKCTLDKDWGYYVSYDRADSDFHNETGIFLSDVLHAPDGSNGMGLIECEIESAVSQFPVLPYRCCPPTKKDKKLLFMIRSGHWQGYLTMLAMAVIKNQVIVKKIKRIQYWKTVSKTLWKSFVGKLYANKAMAGGWKKILGDYGEDKKQEILAINAKMGVEIDEKRVKADKGLEHTAKIMVNCVWGYFTKKENYTDDDFFDNNTREGVESMGNFLDSIGTDRNCRRLVGMPIAVGKMTKIRTTRSPLDIPLKDINKNVCYQVGGQVPAYGQQHLMSGVFDLDPSQPAYCDTDSIFYIYNSENKTHKKLKTGVFMGDWVDEIPKGRIVEFICLGPKFYMYIIEYPDGKRETKGKFKGIPYSRKDFSLLDKDKNLAKLTMNELKIFLEDAVFYSREPESQPLTMALTYLNYFKRTGGFEIGMREESKTIRFTFDKRQIIRPLEGGEAKSLEDLNLITTKPFNDNQSDLEECDIIEWWKSKNRKVEQRLKKLKKRKSRD